MRPALRMKIKLVIKLGKGWKEGGQAERSVKRTTDARARAAQSLPPGKLSTQVSTQRPEHSHNLAATRLTLSPLTATLLLQGHRGHLRRHRYRPSLIPHTCPEQMLRAAVIKQLKGISAHATRGWGKQAGSAGDEYLISSLPLSGTCYVQGIVLSILHLIIQGRFYWCSQFYRQWN